MPPCHILTLGRVPYRQAWDLQAQIAAQVAAGTRAPALLLLEHPHTYTFGRRGQANNLLWEAAELERRGIEVHWVDRGGDVTYHGPGQLVGYPILPLAPRGLLAAAPNRSPRLPRADYVGYLRKLEKTLIRALAELGVASGQIPGLTGVWVQPDVASRCPHCPPEARRQPAKIAAIGVKVDARGVSRHGFALNVNTDMQYWRGIRGCGLDYPVINLADLLSAPPSMQTVIEKVVAAFGQVFGYEMTEDGGRETEDRRLTVSTSQTSQTN